MLPFAHAFSQIMLLATLWTFSMGSVDVGALLLSARLECHLQRRRCRVKDWPCSQAAIPVQVCDFVMMMRFRMRWCIIFIG